MGRFHPIRMVGAVPFESFRTAITTTLFWYLPQYLATSINRTCLCIGRHNEAVTSLSAIESQRRVDSVNGQHLGKHLNRPTRKCARQTQQRPLPHIVSPSVPTTMSCGSKAKPSSMSLIATMLAWLSGNRQLSERLVPLQRLRDEVQRWATTKNVILPGSGPPTQPRIVLPTVPPGTRQYGGPGNQAGA